MSERSADARRHVFDALTQRAPSLAERWQAELVERSSDGDGDVFPNVDPGRGMAVVVSWMLGSVTADAEMPAPATAAIRSFALRRHDAGDTLEETLGHVEGLYEMLHAALREEVAAAGAGLDIEVALGWSEHLSHAARGVDLVLAGIYRDQEEQRFIDFCSALFHATRHAMHGALTSMGDDDTSNTRDLQPDRQRRRQHRARTQLIEVGRLMAAVYAVGARGKSARVPLGSLHRLIQDTARAVQSAYRDRGVQVRIEIEPGTHDAEVPIDAVRVVLHTLIDNGVKHADPDKRERMVRIRTESGEHGRWIISVEDNGRGIPPEQASSLFQRLRRGDGAAEPRFGLGLVIARHASRTLGGELTVVSEVGHGSTFRLELPLGSPEPPCRLERATPSAIPKSDCSTGLHERSGAVRQIQHSPVSADVDPGLREQG